MAIITAIFDSREKAEETVTQLSPFFSGHTHDFEFTTITGSLSEDRFKEAAFIIKKNGGIR